MGRPFLIDVSLEDSEIAFEEGHVRQSFMMADQRFVLKSAEI